MTINCTRATVAASLFSAAALAAGASTARASACTAIVDVSVAAMEREAISPHQTVVVQGQRILEVLPASGARVPAGCRRIDGRDRYLIPGLVDTHIHFFTIPGRGVGDPAHDRRLLSMYLANGVTTALVMEGAPELLRLRDDINAGRVLGPKLYVASPFIQMSSLGLPPGRHFFTTAEEVHEAVLADRKAGYDFIKVHGEMTPEGYAVLLKTAKEQGLRVIGHAPPNLGIDATLDGGQVMIAHAESYLDAYLRWNHPLPTDPAEIDRMSAEVAARTARRDVWVQPTLSVFRQIGDQVADFDAFMARPGMRYMPLESTPGWSVADDPYVHRWKIAEVPTLEAQYAILVKVTKALNAAGVPLLAGTDALTPLELPGFSMKDELEQMIAAGLTPYQALRTATSNPARFFGDKERGSIAPDKIADLVLLSADPFDDIDSVFRQDGVMLRGQWLSENDLMKALMRP